MTERLQAMSKLSGAIDTVYRLAFEIGLSDQDVLNLTIDHAVDRRMDDMWDSEELDEEMTEELNRYRESQNREMAKEFHPASASWNRNSNTCPADGLNKLLSGSQSQSNPDTTKKPKSNVMQGPWGDNPPKHVSLPDSDPKDDPDPTDNFFGSF